MPSKTFTSGRIRRADHDTASQRLELHFDNGSAIAYLHVPAEVYRRLCNAPNPASYWEDRIAEEYPKGTTPAPLTRSTPAKDWNQLFGGDTET